MYLEGKGLKSDCQTRHGLVSGTGLGDDRKL